MAQNRNNSRCTCGAQVKRGCNLCKDCAHEERRMRRSAETTPGRVRGNGLDTMTRRVSPKARMGACCGAFGK